MPKIVNITHDHREAAGISIYVVRAEVPNAYPVTVRVIYSPTGNCQNYFIRAYNQMRNLDKEDVNRILKYIQNIVKKNMIIMDINEGIWRTQKSFFEKDSITLEHPYKSTNGSNMVMIMMLTNQFKNK